MKKDDMKALFSSFKFKLILMVLITVVASSAVTFGFFYANRSQSGTSDLTTSCFDVDFTEGSSFINLTDAISMSDSSGQNTTPYTFTLTNKCELEATYTVLLSTKTGSFSNDHISVSVNKEQARVLSGTPKNTEFAVDDSYASSYVIKTGSLEMDESIKIDVRAWINANTTYADVQGQTWEAEVKVVNTVKELEDAKPTVVDKIIASAKSGTPDFTAIADTDEGVYAMADDYGTSYYFRGAVENNYVKFAGFYWRIIRVNGDGSVRMIYDGTSAHANGASSTDRVALTEVVWNETNYNDAKYVGYMYGGVNGEASESKEQAQANDTSSNAKTQLEAWYTTNIESKGYEQYLADVIFCNDRTTPGGTFSGDTGNGYGTQATGYGAYDRFITNSASPTPTFVCPTNSTVASNNDWFTADATTANKGNGKLDQPVGMITADEIVAAGGRYGIINQGYYLYKGYWYWSLSPSYMYTNGYAYVFFAGNNGSLSTANVNNTAGAVAPVINLTPEYAETLKGSGTMDDPYTAW